MPKFFHQTIRNTLLIGIFAFSCSVSDKTSPVKTVTGVMDDVITRLYQDVPSDQFHTIDDAFILDYLSPEEKHTLTTQYQYFKVNVPVTVSLMRSVNQPALPFWLEEAGFVKTDKILKNDVYTYEIWQKDYEAGWVNLGINGFDMHRTVYFIAVGAKNPEETLKISDHYPGKYPIMKVKKGAFTYHDWSTLFIQEYPEELDGQALFTTVRGRAREAHVKGAFRDTNFPSGPQPDQLMLTWNDDPRHSVSIQWRTNTSIQDGVVKYWKKDTKDTTVVAAEKFKMEDRMLYSDRYIHRFTAQLNGLYAGETFEYIAGSKEQNTWTVVNSFMTPPEQLDKFSFIWTGDSHHSNIWGDLVQKADQLHPEVAFYSVAGDLVTTGLYRSEWDDLFGYSGDVFTRKPFMPVPGNHDRQDGLGAWMYYELFDLPKDAPAEIHPESTYAFEYGNALYLMIDSTHPIEAQSAWIENKLKNSKAKWKFAMFHFAPYNFEEPYPDIQAAWCTLFDKYHVDMVMAGHVHYYMRSEPMFDGEVVDDFDQGTVYITSIGIESNHDDMGIEPYAKVRYKEGPFYQHISIDGDQLVYKSFNKEGEVTDEFIIDKSML